MKYIHISHEPAPDKDGQKMVRVSTYRNPDPLASGKRALKNQGLSGRRAIREGRRKAKGASA